MQMDINKEGADMQTTTSYSRTRYIVKYWSTYRADWVSVMVDVQDESQIAEAIGQADYEIIRNCGRSL